MDDLLGMLIIIAGAVGLIVGIYVGIGMESGVIEHRSIEVRAAYYNPYIQDGDSRAWTV